MSIIDETTNDVAKTGVSRRHFIQGAAAGAAGAARQVLQAQRPQRPSVLQLESKYTQLRHGKHQTEVCSF
ncbi:MAG: twin-arginine translocation signal domain-containing protein [Actinobacteria bacterium]|nr:twin-arginine translocation signal domain-containing protein [Actinomycetota bacterium]